MANNMRNIYTHNFWKGKLFKTPFLAAKLMGSLYKFMQMTETIDQKTGWKLVWLSKCFFFFLLWLHITFSKSMRSKEFIAKLVTSYIQIFRAISAYFFFLQVGLRIKSFYYLVYFKYIDGMYWRWHFKPDKKNVPFFIAIQAKSLALESIDTNFVLQSI